MEITLQM